MPSVTSIRSALSFIFCALAFVAASIWATDTQPWGAGLALLPLVGAIVMTSYKRASSWMMTLAVALAASYAAWRMVESPVADFARSDGLLLAGGIGMFWWASQIGNVSALRAFRLVVWGVTLLQLGVAVVQRWWDPSYTITGMARMSEGNFVSGLYGHYNHFANFLLASLGLAAGAVLDSEEKRWVRVMAGLLALACVGGVILSQSRGAYLALIISGLVLLVCWGLDLTRKGKAMGKAVLLSMAFLLPLTGWVGWKAAPVILRDRGVGKGIGYILHNDRLWYWSVALDVAAGHPVTGGGSRAFRYEEVGTILPGQMAQPIDIGFAHNEILQVLTDYGVIGVLLMGAVLLGGFVRGLVVLGAKGEGEDRISSGLTLGAMAAITGMGVQAMFSYVFHVMPDVLLLGFSLGIVATQPWPREGRTCGENAGVLRRRFTHSLRFVGGTGLALAIGLLAWRDAAAWWRLRERGYGPLERREAAYQVRPDFRLAQELGRSYMARALHDLNVESMSLALKWFEAATRRHPWDYVSWLNRAIMLDQLKRWDEAEECYAKVLPLVELRETYYRARSVQANHALLRGDLCWNERRPEEALAWFLRARHAWERSKLLTYWRQPDENENNLMKLITEKITFLEGAGIKPAELPPAPQWEFPPLEGNG